MTFWRNPGHHILVIGIFQNLRTARAVLNNLHRARFRRAAAIHASINGRLRVEEHGMSAISGAVLASVVGLSVGTFMCWHYRPDIFAASLAEFALAGALSGWVLVRLLRQHVDEVSLAWGASTILPGELVVMVAIEPSETGQVLAILRD